MKVEKSNKWEDFRAIVKHIVTDYEQSDKESHFVRDGRGSQQDQFYRKPSYNRKYERSDSYDPKRVN